MQTSGHTGSPVLFYLVVAAALVAVLTAAYLSSCTQRGWDDLSPQEQVWRRELNAAREREEDCRRRGDVAGAEAAGEVKRRVESAWLQYLKEQKQRLGGSGQ